jgi:hypothetical protein
MYAIIGSHFVPLEGKFLLIVGIAAGNLCFLVVVCTSRNFKFKIPLNCTDGTTLPQYGIYKKQNTGTKLNKSISSAHSILPKNAFSSPNDHENFVHYLFTWGLPLINWYPMSKNTGSVQERTCAGSSL